jgi:hypothetical protein
MTAEVLVRVIRRQFEVARLMLGWRANQLLILSILSGY